MKKFLQNALVLFTLTFLSNQVSAQTSGIFESYAVLSINGGANTYYDMQAVTANPDFNGTNLGSFSSLNTLVMKGGENKTFKNGGCNINSSTFSYRVYLTSGGPSGTFVNINEAYNGELGGGDQSWLGISGAFNALSGLAPGNYTIEAYSSANYDSCGTGTHFSSNAGANYKATFTINPITVTATSGSSLLASYPTLAAAITAINTAGVHTGTVVCSVAAGYTEIAPAGGYLITATGTLGNTITFVKSGAGVNPTFTASTTQTAGALNDAIFKIIGGDYITIDGFTMLENANTTTAAATNNMTEFGVALFYATTTNGCQNVTIRNCSIDLNRTYQNTFGIYANSTHSATNMATSASATSATGGNHNLTITGNTITDVNQGISIVGPTATADHNNNIIIGGSSIDANTITNFGTTGTFSSYANVSGTVNGVLVRNLKNFTISHNTITSSNGGHTVGANLRAIYVVSFTNAPTGTNTNNISNNSISVRSGLASTTLSGIINEGTTGNATTTLNINANDFNTFGHTVAGSGAINFINNGMANLNISISNNTFTNISVNTTGSITFISNNVTLPATGSKNVNSNSIVTAFNKTGAGGTVLLHTDPASSPAGTTVNNNNNNFSNITLTGATTISGWVNTDGGAPTKTVTGNTFSNWTVGTSPATGLNIGFSGVGTVSNNTISNITGGGTVTGLIISSTNQNVFGNSIHTLTSTGASTITGISVTAATANNIYQNKVYNLEANNVSGAVNGIAVSGGTTTTLYNNVVGDLRTPASNAANPLIGINITGGTTVNAFHNTVRIVGSSSGALFGSSAISVSTTPNVTLRNNIFINNSTFTGTGLSVAYRRGSTTLTTYNAASDSNIYYAGTPSANNLIFSDGTNFDQTMAAFQSRVAARDTASQTENVAFISTTGSNTDFLRIALGTTSFAESGGALVSTPNINTDYWNVTRPFVSPVNGGTAVDIGASEFDGIPNLISCVAPADQATAFVAGAVTSNSAQATFTAASSAPTGYLVITSQGAFVGTPVDGTIYSPGAAVGNGAVIQSNATTAINAVGLPSNTTGTITIFSYNSGSCAGGPKYNLVTPLSGTNTTCAGPATLPVTNAISASGFTANWTQAALGNAFTITYSVEVTTDAAYTLPIAGSPFTTTSLSQVISGLSPQTNYYWRVKGNNTICDSAYLNAGLVTTDCAAITTFPSIEPFASYLPTICWKEGDLGDLVAGPATIGAAVSDWTADGFLNSGTTGAAKMNIDTATGSEWILSPYYTIPAVGYRVKYNVGATQFAATTAPTTAWEADDFVELLVSTSNTNWTVLRTYNSTSVPSHLGQLDESDLSAYNGQTVRFAFRAFEGATVGGSDIDFFVDNFTVEIQPIAITVSAPVAVCNGDSTTLTVSSANTNYTYTWSPSLGLDTTSGATVIATPATTTTYTVTAVDGGMTNTGTVTVTVNAAPTAITVTPATATVCEDDITALTVTGGSVSATATIGSSTTFTALTDELTAFNNRRVTFWSQTIYTAAELTAAGVTAGSISSLSYNINSLGDAASNDDFTIKIGATANSNFASTALLPTASMTEVFPPATFTHTASGWQLLNFATPYEWDGTSNIVVNVTQSGIDSINNAQTFYSTTVDSKTNYVFDNLAATTGTLSTRRMNIRFGYSAPAVYSWSPVTDLYTEATGTVPYSGEDASVVYHKGAANTYTATATLGICTKTAASTITVNAPVLPTFFNPVAICAGGVVALPIISTNGITGTWSPAPNNTVTTIYNFIPDAGQCATSGAFITQTVNPILTSTFAQVAPICSGGTFTLPTTSIEGVVGTWSPAINNTATTLYTFTPNAGQCGTTATMTVAVGTTTTWTAGFPNFWSNGAPTSIDGAIIATNYSESATLDACTLTVDNNAVVAIPAGTNVNVQGVVNVISGSMALANTANLNQSLDVTNSGNISVTCTTSPLMRQDYVLWSAPVTGQQLQSFSPGTLSNRFYTYNPSTNFYEVIASPSTTNFNEGTGYLIRVPNGHPTAPTTLTRTFTGVPNNGNVTMSVATGTWNAIGNPYPSTIDADEFITANGITDALYFWRKTNNAAGTAYATYTLAGGTSGTAPNITAPNVTSTIMTPNGTISVGQGFLAKATTSSLSFTNAMRNGDVSTQFFRTSSVDKSRVWLNLFDSEFFVNQTMIAYMPTASNAIDAAIDGRFYEDNIPTQLSSLINGEEFAVQGRAPFAVSDIVPLGFKVETAGNYSVAIDHVDGSFADGQEVFLKDNLTNTVHNLTNAPYSFVASPGTSNTRFEIVFESTLATENPVLTENTVIIFKQNQDIVVNTGSIEMKNVQVYDIQGRLLVEQKDINASTTKLSVGTTNQVLIVKVTSKDNSVVSKKVIN